MMAVNLEHLPSLEAAQQVGECPQLFQAACLVSASSRWLLSESPLQFAFGSMAIFTESN